jgi:uncharacterized protein (TIGR00725 family)
MSPSAYRIAVFGGGGAHAPLETWARETGRRIALAGALLLCGGREGVMAAAAEGVRAAGGTSLGILPGKNREESPPNPHIDIPLFTGLGQGRNLVLALSADAAIAIGGGWGTLSEIALARKHGCPVVLLASWRLTDPNGKEPDDLIHAQTPKDAVAAALAAAEKRRQSQDRRKGK